MLQSKGPIQPHHTNLPRRHLRTRLPLKSSGIDDGIRSRAAIPPFIEHAPNTAGPATSSNTSTKSTRTSASSSKTNSGLHHKRSLTPVTSPLDPALPTDTLPENFSLLLRSQHQGLLEAAVDPTSPPTQDLHSPACANVSLDAVKPHFASPSPLRGHLEPRATNLPRRLNRARKEKEIIQQRCLQEFIPGSGIWIAFDLRANTDGYDDDLINDDSVEKSEHDRVWEEELGFTGVIRIQIGGDHGKYTKSFGKREELELVIGKEEIRAYDDLGIPVLTGEQLNNTATFLLENRRRWNGEAKFLITTPRQRPVEAVSLALFASSLSSTSTPLSLSPRPPPPSYLDEVGLLPGILELKQSQELDKRNIPTGKFCNRGVHSNYTPIHFTLWHVHDLMSTEQDEESTGLKLDWRGTLSLDGIEKLVRLRQTVSNNIPS